MKLKSQTICPTEVRVRLVKDLSGHENAICDMKLALEVAEDQCFELHKENEKLGQVMMQTKDILSGLNRSRKSDRMILIELDKELEKN